jgi:hypothetical protein
MELEFPGTGTTNNRRALAAAGRHAVPYEDFGRISNR